MTPLAHNSAFLRFPAWHWHSRWDRRPLGWALGSTWFLPPFLPCPPLWCWVSVPVLGCICSCLGLCAERRGGRRHYVAWPPRQTSLGLSVSDPLAHAADPLSYKHRLCQRREWRPEWGEEDPEQCELRKEGRNERSGKGSLYRTWYSLLYGDAIKSRTKKKVFKSLQVSVNSEVSNATSTFRVL